MMSVPAILIIDNNLNNAERTIMTNKYLPSSTLKITPEEFQTSLHELKHQTNSLLVANGSIPARKDPEAKKAAKQEREANKAAGMIIDTVYQSLEEVSSNYLLLQRQLFESHSDSRGGKATHSVLPGLAENTPRIGSRDCRSLEAYNEAFAQQTELMQSAITNLPVIEDEKTLTEALVLAAVLELYSCLKTVPVHPNTSLSWFTTVEHDSLNAQRAAFNCLSIVDQNIKNYCENNNLNVLEQIERMDLSLSNQQRSCVIS